MTPETIETLFDRWIEEDLVEYGNSFKGAESFRDFLIEFLTESEV